jgi:hypothetical protein
MATMEIGGRTVVAFAELTGSDSDRILAVYPIPADGGQGWSFRNDTGSVHIWGLESNRGKRIADAYESGKLPTNDRDSVNEILA